MLSRDGEVYKDKIEVSLDGRQVFYLFFGGAIIACLVFVLGVMVGKRVESRAHLDHAAISAEHDPLAALDRLDADGKRSLSFRQALTSGASPASDVDKTIAQLEQLRAGGAPALAPKASVPRDEVATVAIAPAANPVAAVAVPVPVVAPKAEPKPEPKADPKPEPKADSKGKFTLQLSAFQDKAEAQSFLADTKAGGFAAYLTEAKVEGKGTYYRIRLGRYATYDEAVEAKGKFEAKQNKIAYVTRL